MNVEYYYNLLKDNIIIPYNFIKIDSCSFGSPIDDDWLNVILLKDFKKCFNDAILTFSIFMCQSLI